MTIKTTALILSLILLSGCQTSPPKPPMPKGEWVQMNKNVPEAKMQLLKLKEAKGGAQ